MALLQECFLKITICILFNIQVVVFVNGNRKQAIAGLERSSDTLSDGKIIAFQGEETGEYAALDNIPAFSHCR